MGGYYSFFHFLLVCFLLGIHGSYSMNQTCNPTDLEALLAFSNALDKKDFRVVGWVSNDTKCCSWTGVSCEFGKVIRLDLSNKNLHGGISSAITLLDGLVTLNLSRNSLHGQPPEGLGRLARLRILDLSMNVLSGMFLGSEGGFAAIEVMNVSFNQFRGLHPAFPGAMDLTVLDISSNAFSGDINTTAICITPVRVLRFSRNEFTGEVPAGFSRCRMLVELSIDGSGLIGNLPSDLYMISGLRRLSLRENQLSGSLSEDLVNLSQLMHIELSYNMFGGVIPDVFGGLKRLEFLNLASNSLSGHIPPGLMWCTKLRTLNLGRNKLEGEVPASFKNLRSLSRLSLVGNGFTNLSSALRILQHLPKLTTLVLTKNFHGGETMPMDDLSGFKSLQVLVLANCALSGTIQPWLQSMESLRVLDISWNKLNGKIPLWLGNLNNLFYIDLSNNSFSGELPKSLTQMKSLISSTYSREHASIKDLPLFIKKNSAAKGLQYNHVSSFPPSLILCNNLLFGPVLPGLGYLVDLHVLDLSWNNFSGRIPDELSNMSSLEVLNFAHNDLDGSIPSSLTKLNFLSKFDVSYNKLTGDIPTRGQFSTFPNESFVGNDALCLLRDGSCSGKTLFLEKGDEQQGGTDTTVPAVTYITVEVGFTFGLLTVWNILFFVRAWRAAYFLMVDRFFNTIYVMIAVKVNKVRRRRSDKVYP
ncbi:hypothetical protein ACQ4PT_070034 [Festuca glaucescens]